MKRKPLLKEPLQKILTSEEAKAMFAPHFKELADKLAAFEKKQLQTELTDSFHKALSKKNIPLSFAKGILIESEDQLADMLAKVEADYKMHILEDRKK